MSAGEIPTQVGARDLMLLGKRIGIISMTKLDFCTDVFVCAKYHGHNVRA